MAKKKAKQKTTTKKKTTNQQAAGPSRRTCACMHVHFRLFDQHPGFREMQMEIERFTARSVMLGATARVGVTKIPVVVHVVHNSAGENISDAQVKSQIRVLNQDFRAKNPDRSKVPAVWKPLVADANIEFFLATEDPDGNPTNGIVRKKTTRSSFGSGDTVKFDSKGGSDAWPTDRYLNMWVCTLGGGLLGYAQFPGGPSATDGVVILNTAFGTKGIASAPFNKGRTATHEIGHWLNLRHIWGDVLHCGGTDFIGDTPDQLTPNTGKPNFPQITCNNGPHGDMFMNYMDYVDDAAMFMFTQGQSARMAAALAGPRASFNTVAGPKRLLKLKSPFMRGPDVAAVQVALVDHGFKVAVDGIYGRQTRNAVVQFQRRAGIAADGIVGPVTRAALGI